MISQMETDAGLLAYEQVLAFAAVKRKRLPLIYVLFPIVLVIAGVLGPLGRLPPPLPGPLGVYTMTWLEATFGPA